MAGGLATRASEPAPPVLEHIRLILGGPVVWAPAVDGAVVLSVRGDDYDLSCGQDFAIGYTGHGPTSVEL